MSALQLLNNLAASFFALYFYISTKCLDASDYIQEQFELYSIATKFIYEQAAPRINPLTTALIGIQLTSIAIIVFVIVSRFKIYLRNDRKITLQCGETIAVVRAVRDKSDRIPELKALALNAITAESDRKELKAPSFLDAIIPNTVALEPPAVDADEPKCFRFKCEPGNKVEPTPPAPAPSEAPNTPALDEYKTKNLHDPPKDELKFPFRPPSEEVDVAEIMKSIALLDQKMAEFRKSHRELQFTKTSFALDIEFENFKKYPQLYL